MVIENEHDYIKFLNENSEGRCILHVVVNNDNFHSVVCKPLLVFIRNIDSDKTCAINISHYDIEFRVDEKRLINDLNNLYCVKFVVDKKRFLHVFPILNVKDLQLIDFINDGKLDSTEYTTPNYRAFYNRFGKFEEINSVIPVSIHGNVFDNICKIYEDTIENFQEDESYENVNAKMIENLQRIENNGVCVEHESFKEHFGEKGVVPINGLVYTEYNIYTATGRPSNRFGGINYSALNKDNGCRTSFVSRYGNDGMLCLIDYSAYHPHIVAKLINYELPPNAYEYLGKHYYGKLDLTSEEIKSAKNLTFQCMYGNIPPELLEVPFYKKMNEYISHRWAYFKENGYVETPIYKRRITNKQITDATPNKLFNYILQASETEFGMAVVTHINEYLQGKLTKVVLYTYDSLLYDINRNDGKDVLINIKKIMTQNGFPVKCYIGHNYDHMITVNI